MPSHSNAKRQYSERSNYGFARARDIAFAAIRDLWEQRQQSGMKQSDIAEAIGRDKAWVSRQLSGPGNWTLRTLGELCEALDGELEIIAHRIEVPIQPGQNFHAYSGYGMNPPAASPSTSQPHYWRATHPGTSSQLYRVVRS